MAMWQDGQTEWSGKALLQRVFKQRLKENEKRSHIEMKKK